MPIDPSQLTGPSAEPAAGIRATNRVQQRPLGLNLGLGAGQRQAFRADPSGYMAGHQDVANRFAERENDPRLAQRTEAFGGAPTPGAQGVLNANQRYMAARQQARSLRPVGYRSYGR
jgi:hypothetical protein